MKQIAELLGRSISSVNKKALSLGLRKCTGNIRRVHTNGYVVVRRDDYPLDLPGFYSKVTTRTKNNRKKHHKLNKNARYVYEHYVNWWLVNPENPVKNYECLHHVDGDPTNNDISNIQKVLKKDHLTTGRFRHTVMPSHDVDEWIKSNHVENCELLNS